MARRQILSQSERESLLALPDDELTLTRMAYFSEHDLALINAHRKPASRFGFAVLLCYLKNVGFAPDKKTPPSDAGNDSNLLIVFYVQIMPDDFVMQLHRF